MKDIYINLINEIKEYCDDYLIMEYDQKILDLKNSDLSYLFAREIGGSVKKHQDIVLNYGSDRLCYWFANGVKGCDVKSLENRVFESGDLSLMHNFVLFVNGSDVSRYKDIILKSNNAYYCYLFAKEMRCDDISICELPII